MLDPPPTREEIRRMLDFWRRIYTWRDRVVILASEVGISTREISGRTGLARTTILRILERNHGSAVNRSR